LTTFLVSRIGAKPNQIRTTLVHIIYNVFAALLIVVVMLVCRLTGIFSDDFWYQTLNSGGVANVHGLFRLVPAVLLLPFSGAFARLAEKIVPDKPVDDEDADIVENLRELDSHLVTNPGLALDQTAHLIGHMADVALHNYDAAVRQIYEYDPKRGERILQREDLLDKMADASNQYIVALSPYVTRETDNLNQNFQIKALTSFERIGDLAVNITDNVTSLRESGKQFSDTAMAELQLAISAVNDILDISARAYKENDVSLARQVEPLEEVIDELIEALKGRHVYRMTHNLCDVFNGIQFQNMLQNLERISDQCSDLAVYMLARTDNAIIGQEHQYLHGLHHSNNPAYLEEFHRNYDHYFGRLNEISPLDIKTLDN
jgi:phosphate:Na+ symporter